MVRLLAALLMAGCSVFKAQAQAPATQEQPAPATRNADQQKQPDQKQPDQNQASGQSSNAAAAPVGTTVKEFPLDRFKNFSAIMYGGPLGHGMDVDRRIYRSGNLMRMQGDESIPNYYVTDLAQNKSHYVTSRVCLSMHTVYIRSFPFMVSAPGNTYEVIPIGEDAVDGHQVKVEDVMIHRPKNPEVLHFRLYEAQDLQGFPIKIENKREHAYPWVITYKDVRLEPQDESLFIYPDKCQSDADFQPVGPGAKSKTAPATKPK